MRTTLLAALGVVAATLSACGGAASGTPPELPSAGSLPRSRASHVVVVVMENKERRDVIGSPAAPYVNRLARRYGLATRSYGVTHPSLPNYLALTSGSTHGIASNCTGCRVGARSIVDQLEAAHMRWKAYVQDLPRRCFPGAGARGYAKKHNPFMYYDGVVGDAARCRNVVPLGELGRDLRRDRLPTYSFVVPNLCADTHDCPVATGDRFLASVVPPLLHGLGPHGFLVLTYDEGSTDAGCCGSAHGGRITTIVAGPDVRRGARDGRAVDHYGVLRTIEDALGLPRLGAARDRRHGSLRGLFARRPRVR
jgi:hypothetical protein